MGFIVRPTTWEIEHAGGIFASQAYQAQNGGRLPETPMWRMLEFRYDLNAARFTFYHPNIARMIELKLSSSPPPVVPPPITPPAPIEPPLVIGPPVVVPPPGGDGGQIVTPPGPDPGGGGGAVPEPGALSMLLVAVAVLGVFCLHLAKRAAGGEPRRPASAAVAARGLSAATFANRGG